MRDRDGGGVNGQPLILVFSDDSDRQLSSSTILGKPLTLNVQPYSYGILLPVARD